VWLGWKERACNRSSKLVTWSSLMSNDPVLRGRKERACNPWDSRLAGLWACCWPCGLAAGLAGLLAGWPCRLCGLVGWLALQALQALWACWLAGLAGFVGLLACFFFYSFFFFSTSLHLKHNIKVRLYKIKMMHVNKFFLYNVMK
jgi:hypothetical protein